MLTVEFYRVSSTIGALSYQNNRRAPSPSAGIGIMERFDPRQFRQKRPDHLALHPDSPAMNESYLPAAALACYFEIFEHHCRHLLRRKGVKVDPVFERNLYFICHRAFTAESPASL